MYKRPIGETGIPSDILYAQPAEQTQRDLSNEAGVGENVHARIGKGEWMLSEQFGGIGASEHREGKRECAQPAVK